MKQKQLLDVPLKTFIFLLALALLSLQSYAQCGGAPISLVDTANGSTGATIDWADTASILPASGYNWEVVLTGTGPTGTAIASGSAGYGVDSALVSGLTPSTTYDFYVQDNCGGGNLGTWTGPLTFTTFCSLLTVPFAEGFNSRSLPSCWTQQGSYSLYDTTNSILPTTTPEEGARFLWWNSYNISAGNSTTIMSPPISTMGIPSVDVVFYWYNENSANYNSGQYLGEGVELEYSTDGVTWNALQFYPRQDPSLPSGTGQWERKRITMPAALAGQPSVYVGLNFISEYGDNCSLDSFSMIPSPPCSDIPDSLTAGNITLDSATIYWSNSSSNLPAGGYNWEVVASGAGLTGTIVASGTTPYGVDSAVFGGLSPSAVYDFYVQSNCGGALGQSYWAGPLTFSTSCGTATLPLIQGFNSTNIPNCWTQEYVSGTSDLLYTNVSNSYPQFGPEEGTDFVLWDASSYLFNVGDETRLVTPVVNTTGVSSVDMTFWVYTDNNPYYYSGGNQALEGMTVQYSFDNVNWIPYQFYPRQDDNLQQYTGMWKQYHITLPDTVGNQATVYFGFDFLSQDGSDCGFDNLSIFASPPCAGAPSNITAGNITAYTASLYWTDTTNIPANGFNWSIVPTGDSATFAGAVTGSVGYGIDSAVATGLTPNTVYDLYVQSNCGGALGQGYWAGPYTFSTECIAVTSLPWTEGFESMATTGNYIIPSCWFGTPADRWSSDNAPMGYPQNTRAHSGNNYLYDFSGSSDTLFTPGFNLTGGVTYEFSFWYQSDGYTGWTSITAMYGSQQNAAGMTNIIGTPVLYPEDTAYQKFIGQFTPATSGTYYMGVNLLSTFGPDVMAFDDFGLKIAPACAGLPSTVQVGNITSSTASLSWSPATPAPASGYNWELVASGDSANGTVLFSGSTAAGIDSATATGLSSYTSYDLYVQSNCGGATGVGEWVGPTTFMTQCSPITSLPWTEGFEGLGTNVGYNILPQCWVGLPTDYRWATDDATLFDGVGPRSGTNFLYNQEDANDTVFTPGFSLVGGTQYQFYFYYETDGGTSWDSIFAMYGNYQNPAGMSAIIGTPVLSATNTTYQQYSAIFTPATSGTYYFGVKLSSNYNFGYIGFDDFGLQKVVPCPNPPSGGIISGSPTICPDVNFSLTLTGYSPFTTLQWQSSLDSINYSDIPGATQDILSGVSISSVTYFRVQVACADTSYSAVYTIGITPPTQCYCNTGLGGYCGYYELDSAQIIGTSFDVIDTVCNTLPDGSVYTKFPPVGSATTTLQRGGSYTLFLGIGNYSNASAWIDFNQDGSFDPSETVGVFDNGSDTGSYVFTVPANATLGYTGFRIRTDFYYGTNDSTTPCTQFYDGETVDFMVNIADTNCANLPTVLDTISNVTCNGDSNGSITLNITGSLAPYTSQWSNGATTSTISNLPAGTYTNVISYYNGCTYNLAPDTITQPAPLVGVTDSSDQIKCFGAHTGTIYISASGGTPGYTNHWNTGSTSSFLIAQPAGVYTDTITDHNGCQVIVGPDTLSQTATALNVVVDSVHDILCYGLSNGSIYITASGGTPGYQYAWSNGASTQDLLNVPAGPYSVNVTDANGCKVSANDSITQPTAVTITVDTIVNEQCHNSTDGSIVVTVSGGTPPYQYAWTGGVTTFNLYFQPAGTYDLTVTDANLCTATSIDSITAPPVLSATSTIVNQTGPTALGSIATTVSGGVAPYTYRWTGGGTLNSLSNLTAGVYIDTITDANGCMLIQRDTVSFINSINEINEAVRDFNVYPNPSSGMFTVFLELNQTVPVQFEVYSITGQLIPVQAQAAGQNNTYRIDMTDQPDGVYMVKLIAGDYTVVRRVTVVK